ncbi:MAG: Bor family protein [Saprospiraceae bacterium]|nr:Bor family protein [Saprospiraceae bacterium]
MKKGLLSFVLVVGMTLCLSSCYTYTHTVGNGPQSGVTVTEKNHYFVYGLAQGKQSDPKKMANGADDYEVTIKHTFIDGLLNSLTFGIYTPTTTIVQR